MMVLHGCAAPRPSLPPPVTGIALNDVCNRYNVTWQWDGVTQVVILEYKGSKAKALVGSNLVMFGKERIQLSVPVKRVNSTIYVPEDFESKVLERFGIRPGPPGIAVSWSRLKVRTVVIDPGHGGRDPGAKGVSGSLEKNVVLDISKRIKSILENVGIKVIMTRHRDEYVTLEERTEMASKTDADLFLSVHANANPVSSIQGMEVYVVKTRNKQDLEEEQRNKNEKIFVKRMSPRDPSLVKGIITDMMYQSKVAQSALLAQAMASQASAYADTSNRGVRPCRFFVVRNTLIPAVLVEVGFLTNRSEEKKLKSSVYRQRMAEAIARSVVRYAND